MVECCIPEQVVDVLLVRAKQQDSIMSCLRSICYPATLWIPCREGNNKSQIRKLIFTGWTKQIVDEARVTIDIFIRDDIGMNIPNLHPALCQQNTRLTWDMCTQSLETGRTDFYQIQNNQHDPSTHDGTRSKHEGTVLGKMTNTHKEFCDYEHNMKAAAKELVTTDTLITKNRELAAITTLDTENEEFDADTLNTNNKELVTTDTLVTKNRELATGTTLDTENEEFDATITLAVIEKTTDTTPQTPSPSTPTTQELPSSRLKELRTGMTVVCRMYLDIVIEGEFIGFDAKTKMIIIKPTLALNQHMRKGTHLVNIDYIKNISIVKGLKTRKEEEDHFTEEEPPDEDKVLAKYGYVTNTPLQEELPANDEELNEYKHSHNTNVMTNQRKTLDIARMLTYIDETYQEDVTNA
jgi:hypothetical protein